MKNRCYKLSILAALFLFVMQSAWGQGSTSSRITGQITDANESLIGANVIAVHEPTGFQYGTATNIEGLFTLNNVNVGGPYTITISGDGFVPAKVNLQPYQLQPFRNLHQY